MKQLFFHIICLLIVGNAYSQGEWVSASIDNGLTPNSTALYIRSTNSFDANKCDNIVFTVRVPISAGPAVNITESFHAAAFAHISFAIQRLNVTDGSYYYYLVNGTGTVQGTTGTIIPVNTPIKVLELTYSGGIANDFAQIANIENDIPGNVYLRPQFYIQINLGDITNYTTMCFGMSGSIPVNNQPVTGDDFVGTASIVVIPVKFTSFTAVKSGNDAILNWSVENESPVNDRYEIARSLDGINFTKIKAVPSKNNNRSSNQYTSTDCNLSAYCSSGLIYYRIKQVDRDGKFIYSETRTIKMGDKGFNANAYPNPVQDIVNVDIDMTQNAKVNITLTDASGKKIKAESINAVIGVNAYKIDMSNLSMGTYFIRVDAGDNYKVLTIVK